MSSNYQDAKKPVENLLDESDVVMLYLDPNGNVITCNKKTQELTGKSKEELTGKHWVDILCNDSNVAIKQQMFKALLDNSMEYKRGNIFEGSIVDIAKNERIISWNMNPILAESGDLEGVFLLGNDVTLLKEREDSLKKIDDTLRSILSSIKEYALFAVNLEGNITYYDMAFESMFGWQKSEISFKHVGLLFQLDDASNKLPLILEQVRVSGQHTLEANLLKKNGESFPVILNVNQFIDPDGKLVGYIFIAKDITEDKKIEYQIFQSEKMAAIGKLAAGMAHEINNPLFVISGRVQMLLGNKKTAKGVRENLKTIEGQSERIRNIVDRFLTFSRKTSPNQEKADINKLINNVLPFLSYHKLPSHKIRIVKDFAKKLPSIKCDVHQLQEVFINLLINACQAMLEGGTLTIKTVNLGNEFVQINITDTGKGISPDNLKNMFMPFFSTKKEGTGLGLSICYNIIESHHGTIQVESQLDKGTTFIIKLPFIKKGE